MQKQQGQHWKEHPDTVIELKSKYPLWNEGQVVPTMGSHQEHLPNRTDRGHRSKVEAGKDSRARNLDIIEKNTTGSIQVVAIKETRPLTSDSANILRRTRVIDEWDAAEVVMINEINSKHLWTIKTTILWKVILKTDLSSGDKLDRKPI